MIDKFSILHGAKYFSLGIFQNYLVFILAVKYIKYFTSSTGIELWQSNGMSEESLQNITKSDINFAPTFFDHHSLPDINFYGDCLIKMIFLSLKNNKPIYFWHTRSSIKSFNTDFALSNCSVGSLKLTKNADLDKYKYTADEIGFDFREEYSLPDGSASRNVIIFGVDMSPSVYIDNKEKDFLILGKGPTQGLDGTTFTAEALCPINFTQSGKRFVLSLCYNGSSNFLFVNATKVYQFKAKDSEMKDYALCLANISKDFIINNIQKKNKIKRNRTFFFYWF